MSACIHPEPCAETRFIHPPSRCKCDCGRLLKGHKPLPHPGKLQSWRDHTNAATASLATPPTLNQRPLSIHSPVDDGEGSCVVCGTKVWQWGDGRLRHARSAA